MVKFEIFKNDNFRNLTDELNRFTADLPFNTTILESSLTATDGETTVLVRYHSPDKPEDLLFYKLVSALQGVVGVCRNHFIENNDAVSAAVELLKQVR